MKNPKIRQRGDTIIEVMLALSVLGIVMTGAFGIANRSVLLGQESQERGEALKLAESQVEILKVKSKTMTFAEIPAEFCFSPDGSMPTVDKCAKLDSNGSNSGAGLYTISVLRPVDASGTYQVKITWDGLRAGVQNNLSLYYRVGVL